MCPEDHLLLEKGGSGFVYDICRKPYQITASIGVVGDPEVTHGKGVCGVGPGDGEGVREVIGETKSDHKQIVVLTL